MSNKQNSPAGWAAITEGGAVPGWVTAARLVLVLAFAAAVPVILGVDAGRRLFWAAAIAVLPVFWVVGGYHLWRRICPLAVFSQIGRVVGAPGSRRAGGWLTRNYMLLQLVLMVVALSLRLVATNGTQWALVGFVGGATVAAVIVGFVYTGKTWCNFVCPVGMVEKIYTEPSRIAGGANSQCAPCTACKKNCPDIDLEQGYWKEATAAPRKIAYYSWPGLVVGFYVYFYLAAGTWDYYFSGAWTLEDRQIDRWSAPGFYFWDGVPVAVAAPLTLLAFGAVSYIVFATGESIARRWARARRPDVGAASVRHKMLVLAGFVAFLAFYFFGGQPTVRLAPSWVGHGFGTLVVIAASAIAIRRWQRREQDYVKERFAQKLLRKWEWGDAPASNSLQDIYLVHEERKKEHAARLRAYKETIREMVADGVVTRGELAILDSLRAQLGVSNKQHLRVMNELNEEERMLFDPEYQGSVEQRLQQQQYEREIETAVMVAAQAGVAPDPAVLRRIREEHNVSGEVHEQTLARLLDREGPIVALYRDEVGDIRSAADAYAAAIAVGDSGTSASYDLVRHLCRWRAHQRAEHALRAMAARGEARRIERALEHLFSPADGARAEAAAQLRKAIGDELATPLVAELDRLEQSAPVPPDADPAVAFRRLAGDPSPYLRAAIATVLSRFDDDASRAAVVAATEDSAPLVRESAYHALGVRGRLGRAMMERALADQDPRVKKAAANAVAGRQGASDETALDAADDAHTSANFATLNAQAKLDTLTTLHKMMFLRNVPMFRALEPDDLEELGLIAVEKPFQPGFDLCRQGDRGDDVFVLISGAVDVWTGPTNDKRMLGSEGAGACIGEMAAFDDEPRSATVTAREPTRTLALPGGELKALLRSRPALGASIIDVLVARMRGMIARGEAAGAR